MIKLYGFNRKETMKKKEDTLEQALFDLKMACAEQDEKDRRNRIMLEGCLNRMKSEALFAYDMGGRVHFTRRVDGFDFKVDFNEWDSFSCSKQLSLEKPEVDEDHND